MKLRKAVFVLLVFFPVLLLSGCARQDDSQKAQLSVSSVTAEQDCFFNRDTRTVYTIAGDTVTIYVKSLGEGKKMVLYEDDVQKSGFTGNLQLGKTLGSGVSLTIAGINPKTNRMSVIIPRQTIISTDGEQLQSDFIIQLNVLHSSSELSSFSSEYFRNKFMIYLPRYIIPGCLLLIIAVLFDIFYLKKKGRKGELFQEAGKLFLVLLLAVIGGGILGLVVSVLGNNRSQDISLLIWINIFIILPLLGSALYLLSDSLALSIASNGVLKGVGNIFLSLVLLVGALATIGGVIFLGAAGIHALSHESDS